MVVGRGSRSSPATCRTTLYQSAAGQAKIYRMTSAVTLPRDDAHVRMGMSATEPEDTDQLPLPLDADQAARSTVVSIGSARRPARTAMSTRPLEPARPPLTESEVTHRRAMLLHLTKQSA
jgi:hypothetical protein